MTFVPGIFFDTPVAEKPPKSPICHTARPNVNPSARDCFGSALLVRLDEHERLDLFLGQLGRGGDVRGDSGWVSQALGSTRHDGVQSSSLDDC
jgi:hypothetical protein